MLVKVLKPFPYAADGMHTATLEAGAIADVDDSVIEGLHGEGFIEEATAEDIAAAQSGAVVIRPPVEIPADWQGLHWFKLKALAEKIAGAPAPNKAAALAVVAAEVEARG
jgi:hypothetical protein